MPLATRPAKHSNSPRTFPGGRECLDDAIDDLIEDALKVVNERREKERKEGRPPPS